MIEHLAHETMSNGTMVPAGATADIIVRPQRPGLKPLHLLVPTVFASFFTIDDVRIGIRSQMPLWQRLLATRFTGNGEPWICDTIQIAMDFVMTVTNISDEPRHFSAYWRCASENDAIASDWHTLAGGQVGDAFAAERRELHQALEEARRQHEDMGGQMRSMSETIERQRLRLVKLDARPQRVAFRPERVFVSANGTRKDSVINELSTAEHPESRIGNVPGRSGRPKTEVREPSIGWDPFGEES